MASSTQDSNKRPRLDGDATLQDQLTSAMNLIRQQQIQIQQLTDKMQQWNIASNSTSNSSQQHSHADETDIHDADSTDSTSDMSLFHPRKLLKLLQNYHPVNFTSMTDITPPGTNLGKITAMLNTLEQNGSNFPTFLEQFLWTLTCFDLSTSKLTDLFTGNAVPGPILNMTVRQILNSRLTSCHYMKSILVSTPPQNFLLTLHTICVAFLSRKEQQPKQLLKQLKGYVFQPGKDFWSFVSQFKNITHQLLLHNYVVKSNIKDIFLDSLHQDATLTSACRIATSSMTSLDSIFNESLEVYRNLYPDGHPDKSPSPFYHTPPNNQNPRDTHTPN